MESLRKIFKPHSVESRIYRFLSKLNNFHYVTNTDCIVGLTIDNKIHIIGIYENNIGSINNSIIFTNSGIIHNNNHDWICISYSDILHMEAMPSKKDAISVRLFLSNNIEYNLPIMGHRGLNGRFRDVFDFMSLIVNINKDLIG